MVKSSFVAEVTFSIEIGSLPVQTPRGACQFSTTKPRYQAPGDPLVDHGIKKCDHKHRVGETVFYKVDQSFLWGREKTHFNVSK